MEFLEYAKSAFEGFSVLDVLDIILITVFSYLIFMFLKKNNATVVFIIAFCMTVLLVVVAALNMKTIGLVFVILLVGTVFILASLFSTELRRGIWKLNLGSRSYVSQSKGELSDEEIATLINEIVKAVQNMAKNDTGALIIMAQNNIPRHIIDSGVAMNSLISSQVLESIFNTKAPLHDGAVVICGNKIVAAGCFLPLSQELNIPKELGTRHRAALGISEAQRVLSIVVSEETGIISMAEKGKFRRYVDGATLKSRLESLYEVH